MRDDLVNKDFFSKENEDEELIKDLKYEIHLNKKVIILTVSLISAFIIAATTLYI